jgi:hypothetical protein
MLKQETLSQRKLCRSLAGCTKWGNILDQEILNKDCTVNYKAVHSVSCCDPIVCNHTSWYLLWVDGETAEMCLTKQESWLSEALNHQVALTVYTDKTYNHQFQSVFQLVLMCHPLFTPSGCIIIWQTK